jgi:Phage portal protein, SPP1 Gp6-like
MALDIEDRAALSARIDGLRAGFAGHRSASLTRNRAYLRAFSPDFETKLGEHDQWPDGFKQSTDDKFRSSYNVTRAVVELWTSLEASDLPAIRWQDDYLPLPPPSMNEQENEARQQVYRATKLVSRTRSTIREQVLMRHARRTKLGRHFYRGVRRKNIFGLSWLKVIPDEERQTFRIFSRIDPSTVYPIWSGYDDDRLDAILVATRRSAMSVSATYPGSVEVTNDGTLSSMSGYYNPTNDSTLDADRSFVWVEDYWTTDQDWEDQPGDDGDSDTPIRGRVINVIRVNGKIVQVASYPGWRSIPYVPFHNENDRDNQGFSDVATMLPFQDSINRFMSQQQDVIAGESNPKFKYRGDADRLITLANGEVVSLDSDEDIEQIQVHLDVFPTQVHGTQLLDLMSRGTGLPDTVWGRITAAQNSGKALATAWRAVAARMVPRTNGNASSLEMLFDLELGWMELYDWDSARDLYNGNRDFELDFPNQEPRDQNEVTTNALTRMNAGVIDLVGAMEETGEKSPDEMVDRVRADYMDTVLHPEKAQSYLLLQQLKNQIAIQEQQAMQQAQAIQQQLANQPPGGAPGPNTAANQGRSDQANTQAAQQAAPPGSGAPASPTQAGQTGNQTPSSTLVQDGGAAQNRIISKGPIT